jgi:penicillin-binding protein 1A
LPALPAMVAYERPRRDIGFHFVDQVAREAKSVAGIDAITANSYTLRSTISPPLQRAVEETLQEGLWRYEHNAGRVQFRGPEASLAKAVQRIEAEKKTGDKKPAWQQALANARLPLYDVHWVSAVVVERPSGKKGETWRVGLADGRILPLSLDNAVAQRTLALHDVVLVRVAEGKGKTARAELRVRPTVQGTVVVLENKTGRILAMTGGFSYPLSQLNRATQAVRQPGSAIKPLSYLAALGNGLQPNTLITDDEITLPPIGGGRAREQYWTPKNYDGSSGKTLTLRRALENWRNLATVHLLDGGIEKTPEASLNRLCDLLWKLRSIANACAIIRSCSAPSPCAQPISRHSMQPSRMKAYALSPMSWNPSSATENPSIYTNRQPSRLIPLIAPPSISSRA